MKRPTASCRIFKIIFTFMVSCLATSFANAQSNPQIGSSYFFGGTCSSQGIWTQSALGITQNLRKVTLQLKDDKNCQALGHQLQSALSNLESNLTEISSSPAKVSRLSQIPEELGALRQFISTAPDMKGQALKLMMDRSLEGATLSAEVGQSQANMAQNMDRISDFGERISRGTMTGLNLLNQVIDGIPQMEQCLVGDGGQVLGSFISSAVKITAAFSASKQDTTGSQLASTLSKLTSISRESRFSKILRKLNQQEFMSSMACLMELTSESYCQSRDAMSLFKTTMADLSNYSSVKNNKSTSKTNALTNPFGGTYILNTHVSNITKWLQKIQVGVDPKLPTDAIFQNKIQQEVTDFYKNVKTLLGDYNSNVITIKSLPTLEGRQNAVLRLLISVSEKMLFGTNPSGFNRENNDNINFFTISKTNIKIPFFLIGMDVVPDQVLGKTMPQLRYDQWLQANLPSLPQFQDPINLIEVIRMNMNTMIRDANLSAIEYFNKWYIVDKAALVNESTTHVNYTVKESLVAILDYLENTKTRINFYKGEVSSIPTIIDTQIRIKKILAEYEAIETMGQKYKNTANIQLSPQDIQQMYQSYENLINTVYEEFNVMQSRSGFLANRMVNFVYNDYILLIKNNVDFTPYQQDLFYSQGLAAFDRLMQNYNGNPTNIQTDLNMALRINNGNIQAIEGLLKDNIIGVLSELKFLKDDESQSDINIMKNSLSRLYTDLFNEKYLNTPKKNLYQFYKSQTNFIDIFNLAPSSLIYWYNHSDRYPLSNSSSISSPQSEFEDASAIHSQLCIQALAFNDQSGIYNLCKKANLKSPLSNSPGYNISYLERLSLHMNEKDKSAQLKKSLNYSDRICAFRDYNRKNMVLFMGLSKNK
jgi:hypothetical protein